MAGKAVFCILFAACLGAYGVSGDKECETSSMGYACAKELAPYYTIHWTVGGNKKSPETAPKKGEVAFALEGTTTGWVSLGFPATPGIMTPADLVLGWIADDGAASVKGYSITTYDVDVGDENADIKLSGGSVEEEGETTVVKFNLPMKGTPSLSLDGDTDVNYAIGFTDSLAYHRTSRGGSTIELGLGA